jgi:hypothetical protein
MGGPEILFQHMSIFLAPQRSRDQKYSDRQQLPIMRSIKINLVYLRFLARAQGPGLTKG